MRQGLGAESPIRNGDGLEPLGGDTAAGTSRVGSEAFTRYAAAAPTEQVLVSNSGLRSMTIGWIVLLVLGVALSVALYVNSEPQDDPLLTAAVVAGITFAIFLFGLLMRSVTLAQMTRTGDEIKLKTLAQRAEWQHYKLEDV
ncbi:MAG: hypothetical protein AAGB10_22685, partial [Pseudomonadota bacterium]